MGCVNPYFLDDHHLSADARLFASREQLMRSLPRGRKIAELGVMFGLNAEFILTLEPEVLHLLDVSFTLLAGGSTKPDRGRRGVPKPDHFPQIRNHPAVILHEGDGATTLNSFDADSLDWVYVDGDHSYKSAYTDGLAAMRVAPVVVFNDYTNYSIVERSEYGVITAVNQILNEQPSWEAFAMALQRDGYHDLAIRRRA